MNAPLVTVSVMPKSIRNPYFQGVVESVVMWKTRNLGYLVGASAQALATGDLESGATMLQAGRLGTIVVMNDEIRLGRCHIVTRDNVAEFG